jgi:hypothetical protein
VKANIEAINELLNSDIDVVVASPDRSQHLSAFQICSLNEEVSPVMFTLFYIEAKIFLGHYMIRVEKTPQWLELAVKKFVVRLINQVPFRPKAIRCRCLDIVRPVLQPFGERLAYNVCQ